MILGFGVWILADKSSFIFVLRKEPSACPALLGLEGGPGWGQGCTHKDFSLSAAGHSCSCPLGPAQALLLTSVGGSGRNSLSLPKQGGCCLKNTEG